MYGLWKAKGEGMIKYTCDKCKTKRAQTSDNWVSLSVLGGYGSPWGDAVRLNLDLCESCFWSLVKHYATTNCE